MSNTTHTTARFGRRSIVIGAAAIGFALGGYGLAGAAKSVFTADDNPSPSDITEVTTGDTTGDTTLDTTLDTLVDDTTADTVTDDSLDDNGTDDDTSNSIDDHGHHSGDDDDTTSSLAGQPLPDPFTETYTSTGGSITVSWSGTAFTLDSVDALDGFDVEIKDQSWDRIRVEFKGSGDDARIEVRISDDDNSVRVKID